MTPHPKVVTAACRAGIERRTAPWEISSADFFTDIETLRSLFASLLGAAPDNIAIVPAASYGVACAAKNIRVSRHQKILVLAEQFPSHYYAWARLAEENGAELYVVDAPADLDWTSAILDAISTHKDDIAIAALPNHHWSNGAPLDLQEICGALRDIGAKIVLDVTQTLGACPIDLQSLKPDFLVAAGYKWLFCPYGISFLYVDDRYFDGVPLEENWANRLGSDDFEGLVDYAGCYEQGARRFDVGERAKFETVPGAVAAIRQLLEWDVIEISRELDSKNARLAELFGHYGFSAPERDRRAPHFLGLTIPECDQSSFVDAFAAKNIFVSQRGKSLRIASHLYNDEEDLRRLESGLKYLFHRS